MSTNQLLVFLLTQVLPMVAQETRPQLTNGILRIESLCLSKEIINQVKRQYTEQETIFAGYTSGRGLIVKIDKKFISLNKEINYPLKSRPMT